MTNYPLTKYLISHKRTDDITNSDWSGFLWAKDYMHAWKKLIFLEETISVIYDINIKGVYFTSFEAEDEFEYGTDKLHDLLPYFIFHQLNEFISYEGYEPDYDKLIRYFERLEEYEICMELVKLKK